MNKPTIAFIGAGNMAQALVPGLLGNPDAVEAIRAADPSSEQRAALQERVRASGQSGVQLFEHNEQAVTGADLVVFAVKPQIFQAVATALAPHLSDSQPVLSIAAGIPVAAIETWCGRRPVIRAMPNTPALIGAGATALFANPLAPAGLRDTAQTILSAAGFVAWVDEEAMLDAVTGVSGSGPAYFFYLMEAMITAGQQLGLDEALARRLTLETALGTARMAATGEDTPAVLRQNVTSPGGTTERALSILDAGGGRQLIVNAIEQAARRSRELASEFGH